MKTLKELRELRDAEPFSMCLYAEYVDELRRIAPWMLTVLERIMPVCCLTCADHGDCTNPTRANVDTYCDGYRDIPGAPGSE